MKKIALLMTCFSLFSCASDADIARQQEEMRRQIDANEDSTCRSYGLKYGTNEYANCRQNQSLQRNQQEFVDMQMRRQAAYQMIMRNNYGY